MKGEVGGGEHNSQATEFEMVSPDLKYVFKHKIYCCVIMLLQRSLTLGSHFVIIPISSVLEDRNRWSAAGESIHRRWGWTTTRCSASAAAPPTTSSRRPTTASP
jgi:hypothetical protein